MKKLFLILLLVPFHFLISSGNAQTLFSTSTGEISFYSY
ncbi:MAG: hypothetical protein ACI9O5_003476, partial [Algoriphagus sp.]